MKDMPWTPLDRKIRDLLTQQQGRYYERESVYDLLLEMSIWSADAVQADISVRARAGIPTKQVRHKKNMFERPDEEDVFL